MSLELCGRILPGCDMQSLTHICLACVCVLRCACLCTRAARVWVWPGPWSCACIRPLVWSVVVRAVVWFARPYVGPCARVHILVLVDCISQFKLPHCWKVGNRDIVICGCSCGSVSFDRFDVHLSQVCCEQETLVSYDTKQSSLAKHTMHVLVSIWENAGEGPQPSV